MLTRVVMTVFSIFHRPWISNECSLEPRIQLESTDHRARLNAESIEVLECCKSWCQAGLLSDVAVNAAMAEQLENVMAKGGEGGE